MAASPAPTPANRPKSPHLQIWRWHITMATSIFHRASGVALYAGALGLVVWLAALATGAQAFTLISDLLGTLVGQLALYAFSVAVSYHLANGIRHLFWDVGKGYAPKAADGSAWLVIIFALVAPIGVWALANF
jgi:succinate dehydrogenase / fumarate reductase cytochrome b subunit